MFNGKINDNVSMKEQPSAGLLLRGTCVFKHFRDHQLLHEETIRNAIATDGLNFVLDQAFRNQTGVATWYLGLVDNAGFSTFANADTPSSHAGWSENTAYVEAVRQTWVTVAASARAIANTSPSVFTMNATNTIYGFFVVSSNVKGGTGGHLWATGPLSSPRPVINGDVINLLYTINGPA